MITVHVPLTFERGQQTLAVYLTRDGLLAGIQLAPPGDAEPAAPWEPPGDVVPDRFDEAEVTPRHRAAGGPGHTQPAACARAAPGAGAARRLGTRGPRRHPSDGANRSRTSPGASPAAAWPCFASTRSPTLIPTWSARTAPSPWPTSTCPTRSPRSPCSAHPAIDAARVFVAGHSLGGTIAPRVAAAEPSVAGLVLLAGGAQPLQWAAVRQISYLARSRPPPPPLPSRASTR